MRNGHWFRALWTAVSLAAGTQAWGAAATAHPDFSGQWQIADTALVRRPDVYATEADYTPEAWAKLQAYHRDWNDQVDDPAKFCVSYGMPHTMTTRARDYILRIEQSARQVHVFLEYMDTHRTLHLDGKPVPETATPSNQGWSRSHWEGAALVTETTLLKASSDVGPFLRSEDATIRERWTLRQDKAHGQVIDIDITVNDPKTFRHPMAAHQVLKHAPADATMNEYACPDTLWEDHVAAKRAAATAAAKH